MSGHWRCGAKISFKMEKRKPKKMMHAQVAETEINADQQVVAAEMSAAPVDPKEALLQKVMERLEKTGDLPIFSASVNRIQVVGSDPDSDAMELAIEVLKDANFTAKVLRLANSPYYNRGAVKIGALSRAIVMLGFDAVKSTVLAMKMIDSFQYDHPTINMNSMLVNSYMTAGLVKEMASMCGIKDVEQSYVCGLLHNLGEVIFAYTMPEEYMEMKRLTEEEDKTWLEAQKQVIGMPLMQIGQHIVEKWDFPKTVTKTMSPHTTANRKISAKDPILLNRSLSALSTRMMDLLYSEQPTTQQTFSDIAKELTKITGVSKDVVSKCLNNSFKQSCDLAEEYGLDKQLLMPVKTTSDDEERNGIARLLASYVAPEQSMEVDAYEEYFENDGYEETAEEVIDPEEQADIDSYVEAGGDANILLGVLQELTEMMTNKAHLNSVFKKVLEGMHKGVGFDRSMLCLISPDRQYYSGRMVVGYRAEKIKKYFYQFPINITSDLFSKMIMEDNFQVVEDVHSGNWLQRLPKKFDQVVETRTFIIAALRVGGKPIGMFYADKSRQGVDITKEDQRGFLQLVGQAQLALQVH